MVQNRSIWKHLIYLVRVGASHDYKRAKLNSGTISNEHWFLLRLAGETSAKHLQSRVAFFNGGGQESAPMNNEVVTVVSGAVVDMIEVSTQNGQVLESGPAGSLLQASVHNVMDHFRNVSLSHKGLP